MQLVLVDTVYITLYCNILEVLWRCSTCNQKRSRMDLVDLIRSRVHAIGCVMVCVCVSTPGQRVSFHRFTHLLPTDSTAGGRGISSCGLCQRSSTLDDQENVPAINRCSRCSTLGLFPWSFMLPPRNRFPSADLQQLSRRFECH